METADKRTCTGSAHDGCNVHFPIIKKTIFSGGLLATSEFITVIWILEKTSFLIALHVAPKTNRRVLS